MLWQCSPWLGSARVGWDGWVNFCCLFIPTESCSCVARCLRLNLMHVYFFLCCKVGPSPFLVHVWLVSFFVCLFVPAFVRLFVGQLACQPVSLSDC